MIVDSALTINLSVSEKLHGCKTAILIDAKISEIMAFGASAGHVACHSRKVAGLVFLNLDFVVV